MLSESAPDPAPICRARTREARGRNCGRHAGVSTLELACSQRAGRGAHCRESGTCHPSWRLSRGTHAPARSSTTRARDRPAARQCFRSRLRRLRVRGVPRRSRAPGHRRRRQSGTRPSSSARAGARSSRSGSASSPPDVVAAGELTVSDDVAAAVLSTDISIVCVGTPSAPGGGLSTEYLERASDEIGAALADKDGWHVVVFRSTMVPGTCEKPADPAPRTGVGQARRGRLRRVRQPRVPARGNAACGTSRTRPRPWSARATSAAARR